MAIWRYFPGILATILVLSALTAGSITAYSRTPYESYEGVVSERLDDYHLTCSLRVIDDKLQLTMRSTSPSDVQVLAWDTPWDQNSSSLRLIRLADGDELEYLGPVITRGSPDQRSFLTIPAGETTSTEYIIPRWYRLESNTDYRITLRNPTFHVRIGDEHHVLTQDCGFTELRTAERVGRAVGELLELHPNCSASTVRRINLVIEDAMRLVRAAVRAFENEGQHRTRWWGNQSRNPLSAYERMLDEDELVRCGGAYCDGNLGVVVDYVFDNKLRLCPASARFPHLAMDSFSQVEVLIHELAHLVDQRAGSIVDWDNPGCRTPPWPDNKCYGYPNAVRLAGCTRCAQRNAVNYSGFAVEAYTLPLIASIL